jgi:hypothetical protein
MAGASGLLAPEVAQAGNQDDRGDCGVYDRLHCFLLRLDDNLTNKPIRSACQTLFDRIFGKNCHGLSGM